MIDRGTLIETFSYDAETGIFRRIKPIAGRRIGDVAGRINGNGHRQIGISGKRYMAHRLAWLYVYGVWPSKELDHINGIRDDNRIVNLREATRSENCRNRKKPVTNTSGLKGVTWHKAANKWAAQIKDYAQKHKHLGTFDCPAAAHFAYQVASDKLHGDFAKF